MTSTISVKDSAGHTVTQSFDVPVGSPTTKTLYGANFGSGPDMSLYPATVPVARLFPGSGYPTDLTTMSAYKSAKAKKAKVVIIDFPANWTAAGVTATVKSAVADGMIALASAIHEPEHNNKATPAEWVASNVKIAPVIRAAGGLVAPILQAATVAGAAGRVLSDYNLPKGTADYAGFDLYPETQSVTQTSLLPKFKAAAQSVYGCSQIIFGEYAVPPASSKGVAEIQEFKTWAATNVYAVCYWSQDATTFSTATANAWFGS